MLDTALSVPHQLGANELLDTVLYRVALISVESAVRVDSVASLLYDSVFRADTSSHHLTRDILAPHDRQRTMYSLF